MLFVLRLLILKASFPAVMELCDKRVRKVSHCNNLLRKEHPLPFCVQAIEVSPSSPPGNLGQPRASLPWPLGWGLPLISVPTASGISALPLPCRPCGRDSLIYVYTASTCQSASAWRLMDEGLHLLRNIPTHQLCEETHFLSEQHWARRGSEKPSQAGPLCQVEAAVRVTKSNDDANDQ